MRRTFRPLLVILLAGLILVPILAGCAPAAPVREEPPGDEVPVPVGFDDLGRALFAAG